METPAILKEVSQFIKFDIDEKGLVAYAIKAKLIPFLHAKADETKTTIDDALVEKLEKMVDEYLAK